MPKPFWRSARKTALLEAYGEDLAKVVALFDVSGELETALANPAFALDERMGILATFLEKLAQADFSELHQVAIGPWPH
jgi:F0F1-type ATP synthase delta subunit